MDKRFVSVYFPHLMTDWFTIRHAQLKHQPFVVSAPSHGRMIITAVNALAQSQGIEPGMVVADARAILPSLQVFDDQPGLNEKLLRRLAEWCIRFTPFAAVDAPDGLILDVTGCSHLWGGDHPYLTQIINRLQHRGYNVRAAMADTIGTAWGVARYASQPRIVSHGCCMEALLPLPPAALRLDADTAERLLKLGLRQLKDFMGMPRAVLRRRFGYSIINRINQALGHEEEIVQPVQPVEPYQERLTSLEPIVTRTGIEIALQQLLDTLCDRLKSEEKGLRVACFKVYRIDAKVEQVEIGTNRPSHHVKHLYKLFEDKLSTIEPGEGIELFTLTASKVEDVSPMQERLWGRSGGLHDEGLAELLDRLEGKIGVQHIHRYLPDEHYWPERSIKRASALDQKLTVPWKINTPRPLRLLATPEKIEVTAPIPDYPPMLFRYKGQLHKISRADGPERIEQEWWIQDGRHRDYYCVEDEEGRRYWLFRLGHYAAGKSYQWFVHGFFA